MAAERTCGQAANLLSLMQLTALQLLVLDNPPSPLDLQQEQPHLQPMSQLAGATLSPTKGAGPGHEGSARGLSLEKHFHGFNPQIQEMPP